MLFSIDNVFKFTSSNARLSSLLEKTINNVSLKMNDTKYIEIKLKSNNDNNGDNDNDNNNVNFRFSLVSSDGGGTGGNRVWYHHHQHQYHHYHYRYHHPIGMPVCSYRSGFYSTRKNLKIKKL